VNNFEAPVDGKKLRVAFTHDIFAAQAYGGISRYFVGLVKALNDIDDFKAKIFAPLYRNVYAAQLPKSMLYGYKIPDLRRSQRVVNAIDESISRFPLCSYRPNIIHETYYSQRPTWARNAIRVTTVYDMIHEIYPDQLGDAKYLTPLKKKAIDRCDYIFCISRKTQEDLVDIMGVDPKKTVVTHLGFDALKRSDTDDVNKDACREKPYLLFVGRRSGYKNFEKFLRAFSYSPVLRATFNIVCFGGGKIAADERLLMTELGLREGEVTQQDGDDVALAGAYRHAAAFVYPSLYEGFGIPPLEAMSFGCPVLCSNTSSIPEVVGDAGDYFDPTNTESIRSCLENLAAHNSWRDTLIRRGYERCKMFSWERCAMVTAETYRKIA